MTDSSAPVPAVACAVVARVDFGSCALLLDDGSVLEATVRGRLMGRHKALGNTVVVGDRVEYEAGPAGERATVTAVRPRRNVFSRRAAGDRPEEQVLASSLDQIVVVASVCEPDFKAGFVDRVLAQSEHAGIPARLVINKVDRGGRDEARAILEDYGRAGYAGLALSARTREEVDHLQHQCRGRRSLFIGHSGVGKSTLLNALVPGLELLARAVNPKTGKGRHTTTASWLQRPGPDLELIDTPGMRSFGLWGIGPRELDQSYPEFLRHLGECRFSDCRHHGEPGCAVRAAVAAGHIADRRYRSFLKLEEELESEVGGEDARGRPGS
jgi:ribosome biogenesis GTPase